MGNIARRVEALEERMVTEEDARTSGEHREALRRMTDDELALYEEALEGAIENPVAEEHPPILSRVAELTGEFRRERGA